MTFLMVSASALVFSSPYIRKLMLPQCNTGKPVKPEELRKIESIVNEQIKAELDVFAKEAKLADAKRVNGLRAVFGEVRLENLYT